jgi:solute carrier family 45 protein 1/2/4
LLTIWLAVLAIYVIDFSINAGTLDNVNLLWLMFGIVQAVDRALLVDILPTPLQPAGNSWAAKMLGIGSVIGFFMYVHLVTPLPQFFDGASRGNIDLPKMFPIFGSMEIEVLSVVSTFFVLVTHSITAWCVKEKPSLESWVLRYTPDIQAHARTELIQHVPKRKPSERN